jgi:hypothetical protein
MSKIIYFILPIGALFLLSSCNNSVQQPPQQATEAKQATEAQQESAPVSTKDKLDSVLLNLVKAREKGGEKSVVSYANSIDLALENGQVPVTIIGVSEEKLASIQEKLANNGGTEITTFENNLYALVPVEAIKPLAADDAVWTMSLSRQMFYPMDKASKGGISSLKETMSPQSEPSSSTIQEQTEETQP